MIFLKLDSRLLTDGPFSMDWKNTSRISHEIGDIKEDMVVAHGAHNFGLHVIREYGATPEGFVKAKEATLKFTMYVLASLTAAGLPVVAFPPSAFMFADNGEVKEVMVEPLRESLGRFVPLVHGDAIVDSTTGYTFFSSEEIFSELAKFMKPRKVFIAADLGKTAKFEDGLVLNDSNFREMSGKLGIEGRRLTGWGQLSTDCGCEVRVFDGTREGEVQKALEGEGGLAINIEDETSLD